MTGYAITSSRLPQARHVVIVNDGSGERWVGKKSEVYSWLRRNNLWPGYDPGTRETNAVRFRNSDEYQAMCDETAYYADLTLDDIARLEKGGASTLKIV